MSETASACAGGRHRALPANGPILVTICSREWDTCQKQLLTADRSVCVGALWWPGAGHAAGPQECQPCAWCGGRRRENPVPHLHTGRVLTDTFCLSGHRFHLLSLSWAEETAGFPVVKEEMPEQSWSKSKTPVVNTPGHLCSGGNGTGHVPCSVGKRVPMCVALK